MKYRVVMKVSYNEAYFEFDDIESAGEFAKLILVHQVESEDCKKRSNIRIEIIDPNVNDEEED